MESDPILTYAARRHDGRLGLHQWPAGYPVAYDPEDRAGKGDLCGDCASEYDDKGASFRAWGTVKSRFYFRCGGCKEPVFQAQSGHLSFPIPGFAPADGQEGRIRIQLLDGRMSRTPVESNASECCRFLAPCHLVYPYFASLTEEGIGPESAFYEQAMDAMDLHTELRGLIESELRDLAAGRVEEAIRGLCLLRRLQPRHLETTARIALALEKAGRKAEAEWEWEGLAEAFREAGFPEAAKGAREGRVVF
jgi:hypothetical protein